MDQSVESVRGNVILCDGIRESRAIRSFVKKQIRQWLLLHPESGTPEYQVMFSREAGGKIVACRVEIRTGARAWISDQYGAGLQQALLRCMDRLFPQGVHRYPALQPA